MTASEFPPPRRFGRNVHLVMVLVLAALVVVFSFLAARQPIGPLFAIFVFAALLAFIPIPFLAYNLYALARANYSIDRNQLILSWGLRMEQIPTSEIEWVRPPASVAGNFRMPFLRLPGALRGSRHHPDLGPVEFLASEEKALLLVATSRKIFAISPAQPAAFLQDIQRAMELGSLMPAASNSIYPSFVIVQAWDHLIVRYLWLAGLLLNIGLLVWVGLTVPNLKRISLGFQPSGAARPASPGYSLILIPIVSLSLYFIGWLTGILIYRREDRRSMAIVVWAGGVVASLLFLTAVLFILITPA